jgi:PadR family transcriptional regulator, regulatory protein PadR
MQSEKLKGHLDLLLLRALQDRPGHGYAVITVLRDRSDGALDLSEGTIYPALHRLEDAGLLESEWKVVDSRRRRIYQLTARGVEVLAAERREWLAFARAVEAVLGSPAGSPA